MNGGDVMKNSDVLKFGAYLLAAAAFVLIVAGLCYLVLFTWRDNRRTNDGMAHSLEELESTSQQIRQLNEELVRDNEANRREIAILQANLTDLQYKNDMTVELALKLYQQQQMQNNQTAIVQPNITVIVQQIEGHKGSTLTEYIPESMKYIQNLSSPDDTWQPFCFVDHGTNLCYTRVNITAQANVTNPVPTNGSEYCVDYDNSTRLCYHFEEV
jgi:hypothetical protein